MKSNSIEERRAGTRRRRAVVAVQVLVGLTVIIGFAALTIDVGRLYRARAELQSAADSAALAAASAYTTDAMLQVRLSTGTSPTFADVLDMISIRANTFANLNQTLNSPTLIQGNDILTGWIDVHSATSPIETAVLPNEHNAVQVTVRREEGNGTGSNGPVEFFFAPIFGKLVGETSASAVAAFDDHFAGFDFAANGAGGLPLSVHEDLFSSGLAGGTDLYAYDSELHEVGPGADGVPEINLYPHDVGPGNFGLLNIGTPNQGVPALREQIENGISPEDMEAEVGTSQLTFYDDNGDPVTYSITGNPGMKSSLESSFQTQLAEVVGFFLHDSATGSGANLVYNITAIRFGRVMDVKLNGNPSQRGIWIQPVSYNGGGVVLGSTAPSSDGMAGRVVLAR